MYLSKSLRSVEADLRVEQHDIKAHVDQVVPACNSSKGRHLALGLSHHGGKAPIVDRESTSDTRVDICVGVEQD